MSVIVSPRSDMQTTNCGAYIEYRLASTSKGIGSLRISFELSEKEKMNFIKDLRMLVRNKAMSAEFSIAIINALNQGVHQ